MPTLTTSKIVPCLWFDHQGEDAAKFYVSLFPNSRITSVSRYGKTGSAEHGWTPGSVMLVAFELDGQPFTALNGGPNFHFTEAISLQVMCDTQDEIDHYWNRLSEGGPAEAQMCGWLKDRYGLSWQIVPSIIPDFMADPVKAERAMGAILQMKKIDLAKLKADAEG